MAKQEKTNAMRILEQKKIPYTVHDYTQSGAIAGDDVARVLGEDPKQVFKTLVTVGKTGEHYVFLVPVCGELNLKSAAKSVGEKNIEMIKSKDLLPLTGYIHGGCSPIGMKKAFKTVIDSSALNFPKILFSGGKIGLQVETELSKILDVFGFATADISE